MTVVVDTNVAVVANGHSKQASPECAISCSQRLLGITNGKEKLALDDQREIINEYSRNLRSSGQPGAGDAFLKWVLTNLTNTGRCELVHITPVENAPLKTFHEFPSDPALNNFDPDDRKFVAVALAHQQRPPILQAVDTKWWNFRDALLRNDVRVEFLCENDIRRIIAER